MFRPDVFSKVAILVLLLFAAFGCSQKVDFQAVPTDPPAAFAPSSICGGGGAFGTRLTKIMFLVDASGSNVEWTANNGYSPCGSDRTNCASPTDPTKNFRKGSIQHFFDQYRTKSNFQWGFVTFAGTSASALISSSGAASFDANSNDMQTAINQFGQSTDTGGTPYHAVLTAAAQAIANDPDRSGTNDPQYYVIMLTDGYPSDVTHSQGVANDVSALLSSGPSVSLSTIFYGPQDIAQSSSAINLLQSMAQMGNGQFANVNTASSGININDLISAVPCP